MNNQEPIIEMDKQARIWASACHLSALIGLLGIPFGHTSQGGSFSYPFKIRFIKS
ncbi:MAG: hypothetical protein HXY52_00430 [Nitrospirae bacterium]|nr:hypothetical protein [Nitrospirota bacterium]